MATDFPLPASEQIGFQSPPTLARSYVILRSAVGVTIPALLDFVCIGLACIAGILLYELHRPLSSHDAWLLWVEISLKYEGYIVRQEIEVAKLKTLDDKQIPTWMDYSKVPSLRTEARQKLTKIQPATIGQASRISGVSPSDIGILMVWLKNGVPVEN